MNVVTIDGSHGEGGGQILRTTVAVAAATGRAVRVERIRARRPKPGLAAQHLTAVRAAAAVCGGELRGDDLNSQTLDFVPGEGVVPGEYDFDVAVARSGGSAGAATLVLQTVLLPLFFAGGRSVVRVRGGTHVPWSPTADYLRCVWLPALARLGCDAEIDIVRHGFYPAGGGELVARIGGDGLRRARAVRLMDRGTLTRISGRAVTARLPGHVGRRMRVYAQRRLESEGLASEIDEDQVDAFSAGAGIFLTAEYEEVRAGFGALGKRGMPAEEVAEAAVRTLLEHDASGAALDQYLADQLVVPLALATGTSVLSTERASNHLRTNSWVVEKLGLASCEIVSPDHGACTVTIRPRNPSRAVTDT